MTRPSKPVAARAPKRRWWAEYGIEAAIVIVGFAVMNLIFVPNAFRDGDAVVPETAGQLGDFVGGYIGTLFALIGVVLLYATLKNQRKESQLESFENRFFELIKLHRDNVAELDVQGSSGHRLFVLLTRELRSIMPVIREVAATHKQTLDQEQMLHLAYYCLFFGSGPNSSRMLTTSLTGFDTAFVKAIDAALDDDAKKDKVRADENLGYVPWEGHQSRLGHYYRHLYQAVTYVDQQRFDLDKYEYVKMLRAQLSTHEQALLLMNSLTPMGRNWWKKDLLVRYRIVQNVPRAFFDSATEIDITSLFYEGYFEWEEPDTPVASAG